MRFLVTGASLGIGYAVAQSLAERGHDVLAVARDKNRLARLTQAAGERVDAFAADLSTTAGCDSVVERVRALSGLDGVVHSAGSHIVPTAYGELEANSVVADMAIHVAAPIALNTALKEALSGARIVYIDSYSATSLRVGWSGYSIVKAAAQMAARAAAEELPDAHVIRVFPGAVRTQLVDSVLATPNDSPTYKTFKSLEDAGEIAEPKVVGEYVAGILLDVSDEQLAARDCWHLEPLQVKVST